MNLILRSDKQVPLTTEEMDGNLTFLYKILRFSQIIPSISYTGLSVSVGMPDIVTSEYSEKVNFHLYDVANNFTSPVAISYSSNIFSFNFPTGLVNNNLILQINIIDGELPNAVLIFNASYKFKIDTETNQIINHWRV